jgi:hypothetical protein
MTITTQSYFDHLINTGRPTAAESYKYSLQRFSRWLLERGKDGCNAINDANFNEIEEYMRNGFSSPRTSNNFKVSLMGFTKYQLSSMPLDSPEYVSLERKLNQLHRLKNIKIPRVYGKSSLEISEVKELLETLKKSGAPQLVNSLAICMAFFGTRPIELEKNLRDPRTKINWEDHSMLLLGAKTAQLRFVCWPHQLDVHMKIIYENTPAPYCGEYLTKSTKYYRKKKDITSKSLRRTFQTISRLQGTPDAIIDAVMGHESSGSRMGNIYTDIASPGFVSRIRKFMLEEHYMIVNGII